LPNYFEFATIQHQSIRTSVENRAKMCYDCLTDKKRAHLFDSPKILELQKNMQEGRRRRRKIVNLLATT